MTTEFLVKELQKLGKVEMPNLLADQLENTNLKVLTWQELKNIILAAGRDTNVLMPVLYFVGDDIFGQGILRDLIIKLQKVKVKDLYIPQIVIDILELAHYNVDHLDADQLVLYVEDLALQARINKNHWNSVVRPEIMRPVIMHLNREIEECIIKS